MSAFISAIDHVIIRTTNFTVACESYAAILDSDPLIEAPDGQVRSAFFLTNNIGVKLIEGNADDGLAGLVLRGTSGPAIRRRLQRVGLGGTETPATASSTGPLMFELPLAQTRGLALGITSEAPLSAPAVSAQRASALELDHIVIATDQPEHTSFLWAAQLGLDLRMDLSNADWNSRLLFFRCGNAIVEIYSALKKARISDADRFFGLTWRVANLAATHRRLLSRGFDTSDIRVGRKPGTSVFTLKTGAEHVPTLFIGPT